MNSIILFLAAAASTAAPTTAEETVQQIAVCREAVKYPYGGDRLIAAMTEAGWSTEQQRDQMRNCLAYASGRVDEQHIRSTF